ncbi:hypothetical protein [Nocardia sp. bgisy118]|uniref:hypothetical protein n=1 Tax=Nocardia sp. bgisy118 TaxID=3413786 RepID=UPI003F49CA22
MRLVRIVATADPAGNRIDVSWDYPDSAPSGAGVRVVRATTGYPQTPDDGVLVAEGAGLRAAHDSALHGERTYYYALFPFIGTPARFEPDSGNRISATATARYDFAHQIYELLPAIYRRYDARTDRLRRFLELPGAQFDQLYSLTRAALRLTEVDRVDAALLPLLAQWIGWRTDFGLPIDRQRTEIRHAPWLYRTNGVITALDATVTRVTGWPNRTKEFVHNVARTNRPERLNLWSTRRAADGTWATPALLSVNDAYEGRPVMVSLLDNSRLLIFHTYRSHGWDIWGKRFVNGAWQPSEPIVDRPGIDRHPSAARQGDRVWLFWETYFDPKPGLVNGIWRVTSSIRTDRTWSPAEFFGDPDTESRLPAAVADNAGGVWLSWLERDASGWSVRYNRHDGTRWQLAEPATMPPDAGNPPRVQDDPVLLFHPSSGAGRLFLFWARQERGGPAGRTRWTVAYRSKQSLDPAVADWSPIRVLPRAGAGEFHDREPAPTALVGNEIELFWSSTRAGGWSIFRSVLDVGTFTWAPVERVTATPFSERAPAAVGSVPSATLVFRSNASLHPGEMPVSDSAFDDTLDQRYAGSTTVDTGNGGKLALLGSFEDFQTYTNDSGAAGIRTDDNRIARDTVGLFLTPTVSEAEQIDLAVSRLRSVLSEFLPVTTRAVIAKELPNEIVKPGS